MRSRDQKWVKAEGARLALKERFDHCWVSAIGFDQASTLQPILQK
jgi:hypothetical protein